MARCRCSDPKIVEQVQRVRARERRWFRCLRCGLEWYGERSLEVNPDDPVDSAEIIEVHERLADPNLTLGEIVPCHLA